MIENMWKLDLNYDEIKLFPDEIVEAQCDFLAEATDRRLIAKIANYSDKIGYLDDDVEKNFTFEFFITSQYIPNYKFRVFLMRYDAMLYPIKIVLEDGIADELRINDGILCQDEEEFKRNLSRIINSQRVKMMVENINLIAMREESKLLF